jgi:DNA-binding response OmpR family regulator
MKILAADDQPLILKSIGHKLKQSGYDIIYAKDGQEAIELFDSEKPDLAILDLNMPVKTGFDVIEHIRKIRQSQVPIIVMSGNEEENIIVDTFNLGVDDYIEKPVGLNEVLVRVKRLLKQPLENKGTAKDTDQAELQILQKRSVGVVIPCYNEETRLSGKEFTDFVHQNLGYHLCFVNDGSKDNTLGVLNELRKGHEDHISIYDCEKNGGKAEAVRLGVLHLAKDPSFDYIGYLDADLSTDFADFEDLVKTIETSQFKIVSGSRISRMGADITKESARKIISMTINLIIRMILGMSFRDTQCGAKIMTKEIANNMFNEKFVTRWIFDVEIFLRMKKFYGKDSVQNLICEQPLKRWIHADGSKLSMKDSVKIVGQLLEIAIHYR